MPASGSRHNTTGALSVVGSRGYYWSSSAVSAGNISVSILRFYSDEMTLLYSNARAYAFPVRCVQYLQAVFTPQSEYFRSQILKF